MNSKTAKDQIAAARREKEKLEKEFSEKLEALRNFDLAGEAMAQDEMKHFLGKLDDEETKTVTAETADIASGYSLFLKTIADQLADPKARMKILEELARKV